MEIIAPDFTIYDKYRSAFGSTKHSQTTLKTILYATHIRLSIDNKTLIDFPYKRLQPRHPSVIFHDYDITSIPNSFELLDEISKSRPSGLSYRIGNKFPINTYTYQELRKWLTLPAMGNCFYL